MDIISYYSCPHVQSMCGSGQCVVHRRVQGRFTNIVHLVVKSVANSSALCVSLSTCLLDFSPIIPYSVLQSFWQSPLLSVIFPVQCFWCLSSYSNHISFNCSAQASLSALEPVCQMDNYMFRSAT